MQLYTVLRPFNFPICVHFSGTHDGALTDSAVFDDDNTENTFTHGNIVETKTRSNTSTMVIKTSFDEPPSSAAESSLASSSIDTTTACTCGEFRNT